MELAEVYNIRYYGPDDNLRGAILTLDGMNGGQFLFNDMGHLSTDNPFHVVNNYASHVYYQEADEQLDVSTMPLIRSGDFITLSGPAQASINSSAGFNLNFYLFGVIRTSIIFQKDEYEETFSVALQKLINGDNRRRQFIHGDGHKRQVMIRYAVFDNAIEARVKVKLTEVNSVFDFAGTIYARTSAITDPDYKSILFSKGPDEKIRLEPDEEMILQLSRYFVVVPLGSQLILQFALHVDDHQELKTVTFVAEKEVTIQEIVHNKGVIQVEVSWRWERHPTDFKGTNNGYPE